MQESDSHEQRATNRMRTIQGITFYDGAILDGHYQFLALQQSDPELTPEKLLRQADDTSSG